MSVSVSETILHAERITHIGEEVGCAFAIGDDEILERSEERDGIDHFRRRIGIVAFGAAAIKIYVIFVGFVSDADAGADAQIVVKDEIAIEDYVGFSSGFGG